MTSGRSSVAHILWRIAKELFFMSSTQALSGGGAVAPEPLFSRMGGCSLTRGGLTLPRRTGLPDLPYQFDC